MKIKYAGFFTRFIAFMLDGLFLYIPLDILEKLSNEYLYIPLAFIVWWLYNSLMLSSSWGATFGKKILSIKILDENMQQLSFKKASIRYLYSIVSYMFLLPIFMIFFTVKKQTFHDYFAKTIAIDDINKFNYQELKIQNDNSSKKKLTYFISPFQTESTTKKKSTLRTIIIVVVFIAIAVPIGYMVVYMSVMYKLYSASANSYDNSFNIKYSIKDYNNSKINFYNNELEIYSQEFIQADDIYTKFEADVKSDLALGCIQYFVKKHDEDWIDVGSSFRKNARNKYANTEDKIDKAKENEQFMGHNFYKFDLNMVNHIQDDITKLWNDNNDSICESSASVGKMYNIFLDSYIAEFRAKNIYSSFHADASHRELYWYRLVYNKFPDIIENSKNKLHLHGSETLIFEATRFQNDKNINSLLDERVDVTLTNSRDWNLYQFLVSIDKKLSKNTVKRLIKVGKEQGIRQEHLDGVKKHYDIR